MALSDLALRNAKATDKAYKMSDGLGLYALVKPNGSKLWRYDYTIDGKRKTASLGVYPTVGLAAAREARDGIKRQLADGHDPAVERKLQKATSQIVRGNTFAAIADSYLERLEQRQPPLSEATMDKKRWILKRVVHRDLGNRPISEIKPIEVLNVLRRLEVADKRETARRTRSVISAVFRHAITNQQADTDPTHVLRDAILPPSVTHMAAITDEKEFGNLLSAIDGYTGWSSLRALMLFTAYTFCRPGEARLSRWPEFDLKARIWEIPASRMKMRRPHSVPLSAPVIEILEEMRRDYRTSEWVFPSIRTVSKPLSENAINSAMRRMGYEKNEMTAHGFRSSASSILNARKFDPEVIEYQLSHVDKNVIRRTYNRHEYWDERVELMRSWAAIVQTLTLA